MNLHKLTIQQAQRKLNAGAVTSRQLTQAVLDQIDSVDPEIGAYLTVMGDTALKAADRADQILATDQASPLTGIPIALKDLICTAGTPTTCGSRMLERFIPPYDATVMGKLEQAGAVIVGKVNMDEFAMGSSTENSAFKLTRNPWKRDHIPGGSSGGSAAAVATDMCLAAIGSDTGGSIRQPASHCGVVGLKPTYGRVSRFGLVAFASSLDQIGPLTKDVFDCAVLLNTISGHDPFDSTSVDEPVPDFTDYLEKGIDNLTIGVPLEYQSAEGLDPEVGQAVENAMQVLIDLGAKKVDISLPHMKYATAAYYVIAPCEASSNLARYDGVKYGFRHPDSEDLLDMYRQSRSNGFGPEVKRRILLGTFALSSGYYDAYYRKASQVRTLIRDDFTRAFESCDVIVSPVAPTPAFRVGEKTADPLTMYLSDIFTISANLAGIPGMSVPCGFSTAGLPIGLQLMGAHFNEGVLLKVAYNFEQATEFHRSKPAL